MDAFVSLNNRVIDHYLEKSDENLRIKLTNYFHMSHLEYFNNVTTNILQMANNKFDILLDIEFAILLNHIINEYMITEYYMIHENGAFLLANSKEKFILNISTSSILNEFVEMYPYIDPQLLSDIKQRRKIPNFELTMDDNINEYFYDCIQSGKFYYNLSKLTNQIKGI